jgi:SAM-dependent methyltransferase
LRTRGAGRYRPEEFDGYSNRRNRCLIDPLAESKVRILDVGAGPLTMLSKTHPTKKL